MSGRRPGINKPPATRVALARALRGVSQAEMAKGTGLSLASWRRFENGERPATLEVWINAAYMLGLHLEDLVGRDRLEAWVPTPAYPYPPNPNAIQQNEIDSEVLLDELVNFDIRSQS